MNKTSVNHHHYFIETFTFSSGKPSPLSLILIRWQPFIDKNRPIERVHKALKPVLFLAQCITLLPLHGILDSDYKQLR